VCISHISSHTHIPKYTQDTFCGVSVIKNDIQQRDSLLHRRVCLRVARATVSGAWGRDRHHRHSAAAVAAKSTVADRDRPRTVLCQRLRRVSTARQSVMLRRPTNACFTMPFRRYRPIGRPVAYNVVVK